MAVVAIDASSPVIAVAAAATVTSASFTPPSGSLLIVFANADTGASAVSTITSSPALTWTQIPGAVRAGDATRATEQQAFYAYATGVATTVTTTNAGASAVYLKPYVLTGGVTSGAPQGAVSVGTSATTLAASITSTAAGSMYLCDYVDDNGATAPTAAAGTTIDGSNVTTGFTFAALHQTATATGAQTMSIGTTAPSPTLIGYVSFEIKSGVVTVSGAAPLTGAGTLAASGMAVAGGPSAYPAAAGTLTATVLQTYNRAAALTAAGTLTPGATTFVVYTRASATLRGAGSLSGGAAVAKGSAIPSAKFDVSFTDSTATPVWTDITAYLDPAAGVSLSRGRQYETDAIQPGTMHGLLDDSDGRFTGGRVASPYYPYVKPRRRCRLRVTTPGGESYDVFNGYVERWPTAWPGGATSYAVTPLVNVDRSARLAKVVLRSPLWHEIMVDAPDTLFTLGEPSNSPNAANSSANTAYSVAPLVRTKVGGGGAAPGTGALGATSIVTSDSGTALAFAPARDKFGNVIDGWMLDLGMATNNVGIISAPTGFSVELTFSRNVLGQALPANSQEYIFAQAGSDGSVQVGFVLNVQTGLLSAVIETGYRTATRLDLINVALDGTAHHVVLSVPAGGQPSVILDGYLYTFGYVTLGAGWQTGGTIQAFLGARPVSSEILQAGQSLFGGSIQYFATYTSSMSLARAQQHNRARLGWPNDPADVRINHILDYAGWPAADRAIDQGIIPLAPQRDLVGKTALAAIQGIASDEAGVAFTNASGQFVLHNYTHRNNRAPIVTLSGTDQSIEGTLTFEFDDTRIANIVTVTAPTAAVTLYDQASRTDYGDSHLSVTANLAWAKQVADRASFLLATRKQPSSRISKISVDLMTQSQFYFLLNAEISDRITLINMPPQAPSSTLDYFIEKVSLDLSTSVFRVTFEVSPLTDPTVGQTRLYLRADANPSPNTKLDATPPVKVGY